MNFHLQCKVVQPKHRFTTSERIRPLSKPGNSLSYHCFLSIQTTSASRTFQSWWLQIMLYLRTPQNPELLSVKVRSRQSSLLDALKNKTKPQSYCKWDAAVPYGTPSSWAMTGWNHTNFISSSVCFTNLDIDSDKQHLFMLKTAKNLMLFIFFEDCA